MSQKNTLPIVAAVVAILAIAGGAYFFATKNMANDAAPQQAATPSVEAPAETATATTDAPAPAVEPAATGNEAEHAGGEIQGVEVKPGNPIVARVDGKDITRVDVYRYIQLMPANIQQLPAAAVYPLALDQVVNTRIVQNKAEAAGLENDPEVKEQLSMAEQQIIRSIYVQRMVDKEITDAELKKAYDQYVKQIPEVQELRASHILVETKEQADALVAELKAGGDFAALAAKNSKDPGNKDNGGDLGFFGAQDMVKEFSDFVFQMEPGSISETPVQTQFGWHVVQVTGKRTRPKPSFEEVKPSLQVELRRQILEEKLEDWKEAAKIETFDINGEPLKAAAPVSSTTQVPATAPAAGE